MSRSLIAVHDATFLLGPAFCAAVGNGLILGYLMLRSGLVPRRFAQIVKGFRPSPILYDGRHTGVDGPLIPVLAAPRLVATL